MSYPEFHCMPLLTFFPEAYTAVTKEAKPIRKQGADNKWVREIKGHMMSPHTVKVIWVKDYTGSRGGGHYSGL